MASPIPTNPDSDQVLVERNQFVKTLTLNRPRQLNALSYAMVFRVCEEDPGVRMIMLKGRGRACCAGGDVKAVVQSVNNGEWRLAAEHYRQVYALNHLMATNAKPQVRHFRARLGDELYVEFQSHLGRTNGMMSALNFVLP